MNFTTPIETALKQALKTLKLPASQKIHLEHPQDPSHGDYATNTALLSARTTNKPPLQLAQSIAKKLKTNKTLKQSISKIEVAPPGFINFWIKHENFKKELIEITKEKEKYGSSSWGKDQTWLIEHTSPNPNKAMHLGHLRNNVTGMAIANLWQFSGIKVIRDCIDNDRGIAITKLMWGYLKFAHKQDKKITDINYWYQHQSEWHTPKSRGIRPDKFVDELYVAGSEDFKKDQKAEKQIRQLLLDWENEDKTTWALWKKVLNYSYKGQQLTLKRLGNHWDKIWHEHEHYKKGKKLIKQGLKKGIFKKLSDGAILSHLKNYNLSDTILIKSDGTALYITQDISLTKLKKDTFHPHKIFWVIGPEQSLALKQLFAICEQLGIGKISDFTHISYGWMTLKGQGRMSSRLGNAIFIDDLIDTAKAKIFKIIDKSKFKIEKIDDLVEAIAIGAIKYSTLKVDRTTDTAFDFDTSLTFEGNSGPYLQYTHARCQSVLIKTKNTKFQILNPKYQSLNSNPEELSILRCIYRFPETVQEAAEEFTPNLICNFLFDLAQKYNTFYNKHRIIDAKSNSKVVFRLLLTATTAQVLKNGLTLLGISAPDKM